MKIPKLELSGVGTRIREAFLIQDGEKRRLNLKLIGLVVAPLVVVGSFCSLFLGHDDTSYLAKSGEKPAPTETQELPAGAKDSRSSSHSSILQDSEKSAPVTGPRGKAVKYSAKQVIDRSHGGGSFMAIGSNFIGKLLTAIDTRDDEQMIKVLLPYGGTYKGERVLDPGSILFGSARYAGKGDKVFLRFSRAVNPEGAEYQLQAQALSSKDFSPGLSGDVHTNLDSRMMATVGMSVLSAGADVLVEKEALGQSFAPTPKATIKNAAMAGVSRAAQVEAERRASEVESEEIYVTVASGTELIVSLTESFKPESPFGSRN